MRERPKLNKELDAVTSRSFYYLKQELADFCKENRLPASGSKAELTDRIAYFLDTGKAQKPSPRRISAVMIGTLTEDTVIEPNIVRSEKHRAFFCEKIGKDFKEKKQTKTEIGRQFEYTTYIRDFFADNPGKGLHDAIVCWNYKKGLPGTHQYEQSDLCALD